MKEVDLGKLSKTELRVFENINEMLQVSGHPERLRLLFQGGAEAVGFENLNPDGVKKFLEWYTDEDEEKFNELLALYWLDCNLLNNEAATLAYTVDAYAHTFADEDADYVSTGMEESLQQFIAFHQKNAAMSGCESYKSIIDLYLASIRSEEDFAEERHYKAVLHPFGIDDGKVEHYLIVYYSYCKFEFELMEGCTVDEYKKKNTLDITAVTDIEQYRELSALGVDFMDFKIYSKKEVQSYLAWLSVAEPKYAHENEIMNFHKLDRLFMINASLDMYMALVFLCNSLANETMYSGPLLDEDENGVEKAFEYFMFKIQLMLKVTESNYLRRVLVEYGLYFDVLVEYGMYPEYNSEVHVQSPNTYPIFLEHLKFSKEIAEESQAGGVRTELLTHYNFSKFRMEQCDGKRFEETKALLGWEKSDESTQESGDDNRDLYFEDGSDFKQSEAELERETLCGEDSSLINEDSVFDSPFDTDLDDEFERNHVVSTLTWYDTKGLRDELSRCTESSQSAFIKKMLRSGQETKPVLTVKDEAVFEALLADFPNFAEVIDFYKAQFRLMAVTGRNRITPVLLLGPPGVGKTMFTRKLAQALNTGFTYVDMSTASSSWVLTGLHASWNGAKCGKILDAMLQGSTASPIVMLDELEKPVDSNKDPKSALYQLLEESSSTMFVDEFLDYPVDVSSIIYVACANSLLGLSEPLMTRFKIFDIENPDDNAQDIITQNIYKSEINGFKGFAQTLSVEIVQSMRNQPLRIVKQKISDAVGRVLLESSVEELHALKKDNASSLAIEMRHFKKATKKVVKLGF